MMAGSEHTDNALHSQLSTDPHSPCGKMVDQVPPGKLSITELKLLIK